MPYTEGPIKKYLDDAASNLPAPGGGSVAAFVGALGASMSAMVANFTIGKKKYADVEEEIRGLLERVETQRKNLTALVDADVSAYGGVSKAYGMPKSNDEEKEARSAAIKEACREALAVPMDVARSCGKIAEAAERLVDIGNKNLITDVGVSALSADAACKAAALNVEINLSAIRNEDFSKEIRSELDPLLEKVESAAKSVMEKVKSAI